MRATHNFPQGSAEWHQHRAGIFNASEAPAVMGASKYTSRSELLRQKATGLVPEVSPQKQALFDHGHAVEPPTIAMIEEDIGDQLAPVVSSMALEGLKLGASYDGLTLMEDVAAEVKLWNEDLARQIRTGDLDPHYVWQLEQQFIVTPTLERIIFATSDGTRDRFVSMEYRPMPGLRDQLIAGWRQFATDLAAYVPPAATAPAVVAAPVQALPAVSVVVDGTIAIRHNLPAFEVALRDFLEHRLIRAPKSDQDFADLDVQIKAMKGAEAALESAETNWIAQLDAVATAKRQKDMLLKLTRDNRLMAEKLLASEKERRKGDIVAVGVKGLADHIAALNKRLGKAYMPAVPADFGGCIRGMKSLASMEDKVATELARAKIAASETADRIEENLRTLRELASDHPFLFADTAALVLKAPEDCRAQVTSRIAEHRAAEERRLEAERARIRQEEEARARAQAEREQREREAAERRQQEAEARAQRQREEDAARAEQQRQQPAAPDIIGAVVAAIHAPAAPQADLLPADNVVHMPTKTQAGPPTLMLREINARLAPLSVDAAGLAVLGFPFAAMEKAAKLYHEADFPRICDALIAQVARAKLQHLEAA